MGCLYHYVHVIYILYSMDFDIAKYMQGIYCTYFIILNHTHTVPGLDLIDDEEVEDEEEGVVDAETEGGADVKGSEAITLGSFVSSVKLLDSNAPMPRVRSPSSVLDLFTRSNESAVETRLSQHNNLLISLLARCLSPPSGDADMSIEDDGDVFDTASLAASVLPYHDGADIKHLSSSDPRDIVHKLIISNHKVIYSLVSRIVTESPLQSSPALHIIKQVVAMFPTSVVTFCKALEMSVLQYLERERDGGCSVMVNSKEEGGGPSGAKVEDVSPLTLPCGNPSGLVQLLVYLVQVLQDFCSASASVTASDGDKSHLSSVGSDLFTCTRVLVSFFKCSRETLSVHFEDLCSTGTIMIRLHAAVAPVLFQRLLRCWPSGCSGKEVIFIQMVERLLVATPPQLHQHPALQKIFLQLIRKISDCIESKHILTARQAVIAVSNM
jgi:hypothetical protein